jgi:hypothetical protein
MNSARRAGDARVKEEAMFPSRQVYTEDGRYLALWQELGSGAPTVIAFAQLCSHALAANRQAPVEELIEEARAILYAARRRGTIEIKGVNHAFESSERFLTVSVELDQDRQLYLKRHDDPELTVRFLDGFRQLCASGLVMHHLFHEFSLTRAGFELARTLRRQDLPILEILAAEQMADDL